MKCYVSVVSDELVITNTTALYKHILFWISSFGALNTLRMDRGLLIDRDGWIESTYLLTALTDFEDKFIVCLCNVNNWPHGGNTGLVCDWLFHYSTSYFTSSFSLNVWVSWRISWSMNLFQFKFDGIYFLIFWVEDKLFLPCHFEAHKPDTTLTHLDLICFQVGWAESNMWLPVREKTKERMFPQFCIDSLLDSTKA